ncbi:MAG: hypothetical protein ABI895_26385 [Deltaproteobacteria bacterium]
MRRNWPWCALTLAGLGWLGCTARPPAAPRGIELEDPHEGARAQLEGAANGPDAAVGAADTDPPAVSSEDDDSRFVYSREPGVQLARGVPPLPLHINESWWPFRAQQLGITPAQAQKRDARFSEVRAPAGENGGPATQSGRAGMPAWRSILSTEMMWALLYFLEHQSGGIESRFPPSLYPRRPSALGKP